MTMTINRLLLRSITAFFFLLWSAIVSVSNGVVYNPRHCHGTPKHIHLAVGKDPTTSMTVSFATKWADPDVEPPLGGIRLGTTPDLQIFRFIPETEMPISYTNSLGPRHTGETYYSPFQHHITIDKLQPDTTYYYVIVTGDRSKGNQGLSQQKLQDHPSQHLENWIAETKILDGLDKDRDGDEEDLGRRRVRRRIRGRRKLAPPPYDGHEKPCTEVHRVRTFRTAPDTTTGPVSFAIIGDLGQFDHSKETLTSMQAHNDRENIDAVILAGDIAYTGFNPRGWDTFFDFIDDFSIFGEVPLMIANGNHDIEKPEDSNEIFLAYEWRFRMPQIRPAELGVYDGPVEGLLDMERPPYPLPYEWGNAYYSFVYGPVKNIIVSAYSSMDPGSQQYEWLDKEMASVDRSVTPWLIVTIHVPIYNTFSYHPKDLQIFAARDYLEPLFVRYNVNVVFTGHIHAYQRTKNVAMGNVTATGPIHITVGAGGRNCDAPFKTEDPENWLVKRDASYYGYGKFDVYNQTHAHWRWIPLSPSEKHGYNFVNKHEDVHLPQLEHDEVMIENQYFLN